MSETIDVITLRPEQCDGLARLLDEAMVAADAVRRSAWAFERLFDYEGELGDTKQLCRFAADQMAQLDEKVAAIDRAMEMVRRELGDARTAAAAEARQYEAA